MPVHLDESLYPLVVIHIKNPMSDEDVREQDRLCHANFERMEHDGRRGVLIVNNDPTIALSRSQSKYIMVNLVKRRDLVKRTSLGVGMVVHSPLQRSMMKALSWVVPSPAPTPFASLEEAVRWGREQLAAVAGG